MTIYNRPDDLPAWAESGDRIQPSNAQIQAGWPLSTIPPSRQRFNWILNYCANGLRYLMQRGIPAWSIDEDYPAAGRVQHNGLSWIAMQPSGTSSAPVEPGTDILFWERWGYSESDLFSFLDPITPDGVNNRVGINNASPTVTLDIAATDAIKLPNGTTAQRPAGTAGLVRYNATTGKFEGFGAAWGSLGGGAVGGGADEVFYENGQNVTTNYTITAGKNAMTAGPITINDGVTVTVPDGSVWTIV